MDCPEQTDWLGVLLLLSVMVVFFLLLLMTTRRCCCWCLILVALDDVNGSDTPVFLILYYSSC
jgi:hypothetical protein